MAEKYIGEKYMGKNRPLADQNREHGLASDKVRSITCG